MRSLRRKRVRELIEHGEGFARREKEAYKCGLSYCG